MAGLAIEYVCGDDRLAKPVVVAIGGAVILANPDGLDGPAICRALMTSGYSSLVCYGVDYLAAAICPDDLDYLRDVWAGYRVDLDGWGFQYSAGRGMWIRRNGVGLVVSDLRRWSPGGFPELQYALGLPESPVVDRWAILDTPDGYQQARDLAISQSLALVDVAERLDLACTNAGLPRYWRDGPGRIAGSMLDRMATFADIKRWPKPVTPSVYGAYYGGRIEQLAAGVFPDIVQADIRSAYPWAMAQLPSLNGARWFHRSAYDPAERWAVWWVDWDIPDGVPLGPFPVRYGDEGLTYPRTGRGWYWTPEVSAALDLFGDCIQVGHGVAVHVANDEQPFARIADYYQARAEARARGLRAEAFVLKLSLNAAYGRLAQELLPDGTPGRWASIAHAGMLTSLVRARVLRAAMSAPGRVLQIHTDSITYLGTEIGPDTAPGDGLGDWSITTGQDALILPSGAYHCASGDAQMDRVVGLPIEYQNVIDWAVIRDAWQSYGMMAGAIKQAGWSWHEIKYPVFVGIGQAVNDKKGAGTRFRRWLQSPWDLIGTPGSLAISSRDRDNPGAFHFRPRALPVDAAVKCYQPRAGLVPRREHQGRLTLGQVILANDQPGG